MTNMVDKLVHLYQDRANADKAIETMETFVYSSVQFNDNLVKEAYSYKLIIDKLKSDREDIQISIRLAFVEMSDEDKVKAWNKLYPDTQITKLKGANK